MDDTRTEREAGGATTLVGGPLTKTTAILEAALLQVGEEFAGRTWTDEVRQHIEAALTVLRENTTPADATDTSG